MKLLDSILYGLPSELADEKSCAKREAEKEGADPTNQSQVSYLAIRGFIYVGF